MLAEGSEEGASTLINTMADIMISKDKSQWQAAVDGYKADGKTEGQAFGLALRDQALALGVDMLGGGISGGVMAGGNVAINKVGSAVQNKQQANTPPKTLQEAVQQQISGKLTAEKPVQVGTVELDAPTVQVSDQVWQQSRRLAAATGRKIRLYEGAENVNGSYDTETGTIWVNTKGGDVLTQVFSHEMTHSLEEAGAYEKLSEIVLSRMQATGIDLDVAREAKRKQYERQGHALQTAAEVDQELVAEYVSKYLLTDEASIVSLVKQDRTLGQRIKDWFDGILAKLGNKNAQERAFLVRARDIYAKALRQTQGLGTAQGQQGVASAPMGESDVQKTAVEQPAAKDDFLASLDAQYAAGEITDAEYDGLRDEYERWQEEQRTAGERKYSFKGYADDGKGIYESNFPKGTPKKAKGERILRYIQDVWSKKPITLRITDGGTTRYIEAQFDPAYSEDKNVRTDASKLMGGNRHGNATEQRVTLDLADDYYQIASESEYNYSKDETGKDSSPHQGVRRWHYFINDIYFAEQGSEDLTPYRVSINVKEKGDGHYFYNFSAEKTEGTSTQRTLHAAVNDSENATANGSSSVNSIHPNDEEVNKKFSLSEDVAVRDNENRRSNNKKHGSDNETLDRNNDTVSKKDVARELQAILQRGGDIQELKRYVAQLERSGGKAEQKGHSAEQTGSEAEQIVRKAKQQGVSVEQYLQENAELYDVDGQWNADARKALEMEKKGGGRKYSLSDAEIQTIQNIGRKSVNQFSSAEIQATEQFAKQYWKEMGVKSPFFRAWFGDWRANDQTPVQIADQQGNARGVQRNEDTGWDIQVSGKVFNETSAHKQAQNVAAREYLPYINDIVKKAVLLDSYSLGEGKAKSHNSLLMHSMYAVADTGNGPELLKLYVEEMSNPNSANTGKRAYQLQNIESQQLSAKGSGASLAQSISTADIKSVADLFAVVKQHDANFTPKPASKIVKEDGTPKVVYHGSYSNFSVFDGKARKHSDAPDGSHFFTDNMGVGYSYTGYKNIANPGGHAYKGGVYPVYLNVRNPLVVNFDGRHWHDKLDGKDVNGWAKYARDYGYDGLIVENIIDEGGQGDQNWDENAVRVPVTDYVVFRTTQIKSATDNIGTFDRNNPDIRYSLSDEAETATAEEKPNMRSTMPKKAKAILDAAEHTMQREVTSALHVPSLVAEAYLAPVVQELSDIYLDKGTLTEDDVGLLFDKFYANGVVACKDYLEKYSQVAERLRGTTLTPTADEQRHVFDYKGLKEAARGKIRIVSTGGITIAEAYQMARSMQPDLFPDDIETAHSQAWRLVYAVQNAQLASNRMEQIKSDSEAKFREKERTDFNSAVSSIQGKLWEVKRFAEDKVAREKEAAPATAEEANTAYQELKKAKRVLDRAKAKNLLTEQDEMQVGRLLRHEIELEHLNPEKDNVKGIAAVFEAKQEYERLCKLITEYKQHLRGEAKKRADSFLQTANDWKDKKIGIAYSRETMERNIFDIVKDKALAQRIIDQYFTPVHKGEAAATRFKNDYRDRIRALQLSTKVSKGNLVSEAHAVQLLGEAEDNIRMLENTRGRIKNRDGKNLSEWRAVVEKLWAENPNLDKGKIEKAVKEFRHIYDALFQEMNRVRVANGYEPVNYRNGYFPHFQPGDSDSILAQFGRALGIDTRIDALPTTINGLTHTFKPGIQWFGNAQERLGFNTAYDAVEGFDKYIEGVASVIYQTANIQNLRALASQIRYRTSDEGIREQVDAIQERPGLSEEEKQQLIQEVYAHGKFTLSNFVTELDEYTNLLANKKSRYDRSIEAAMGRKAYTFLKAWEARVGANMIAGNLTSALTNFIPLTQAGAQMDRFALLNGILSTLRAYRSDDGIVNQSTFLTNRRGSDPLVQTWAQKASDKLGKPMEVIDGFVADSIVRGAYLQNLKKGMSEAEAMDQADAFASSVMADRSKGSMPTMLQARNPLFKAFTQFQLEVNNQFSEVFKDIPRRFKEKGLATLAWVLLKYFLGAWLYNELYEELIGRRPALDPIGMLCQAYDDLQNDGFGTAGANLAVNALEQLPFSSGLTLIGMELDGGRIPASSAVPDLTALWSAATTEGWSAEKRWKEVQDELNKLAYVVPPFGGNQVSKAVKGVKAYIQGGSYNVDAEGNDILQYPVYKDEPKDAFWSLVQAAFLGKSSLGTAQDWVDSGFDGLNAKQTAAYQALLELGAADRVAFDAVTQLKNAGGKDMDKLQVIPGLALTDEEKAVLVGSVLGTELLTESGGLTPYAKFDYAIQNGMGVDQYIAYRASGADMDKYLELRDAGASVEDAMNAGMALAELKERVEDPTTVQKWRVVIDSTDDPEKQLISLSAVMASGQYAKLKAAYGFGVSPETYVQINEVLPKYDKDGNGRYTQAEVTKAIGSMKAASSVKAVLWQLITGSSSAKNNPYSQTIGQKVIDAWEKAKAESEAEGLSFQEEIMRQIMGG